ncbi:pilus assembly FimT family protein [Reinekea marinisedimentorum]|uniref:Type II secretion system protein H n=1 Tax=Reinekea marinisedimentorum TaxID=230495 RepID=A0A4R3I6D4_9GAMM|nr:GspH/FimT family pseudopilin [Reinekea marinisedimentorum]TCS41644.1 prepilin-type N-terminal cleavage/methylation domain-containing protein [Reinekea marinisedimentorum]
MNKNRGFTVIELVTVIILLGILSAVTLPRFFSASSFTDSYAKSEFENALSWARNRAVTSNCTYEMRLTDSGWAVYRDNECSTTDTESGCSTVLKMSEPASDGAGIPLTGESPYLQNSSSSPQRLVFFATGELEIKSSLASGSCTAKTGTPATSGTIALQPNNRTLSYDGTTAYVEVQ